MRFNPLLAKLGRRTLLGAGLGFCASQIARPLLLPARAQPEDGSGRSASRTADPAVADFYKKRDITLLVASAPGGVNDLVGRLIAKHLTDFIPGSPSIIVENLRAAGIVLANRLYANEPKDGSVVAMLERSTPQLAVVGDPNVRFDPLRLTWLGSVSSYAHDAYVLVVNASFPAKTVADLKVVGGPVARIGTTGAGSTNAVFTDICRDVLKLNVKNIRGYRGAADVFLAQERGELDGQVVGFSSMKAGQAALWKQGFFRPLIAFGRETRLPELPEVPTGQELTKDPNALALIKFAEAPFHMALPQDAQKLSLDVSPVDGDAVLHQVEMLQKTPKAIIAEYNRIVPLSD